MKKIIIVLFLLSSWSTFAQSHKYDYTCSLCKQCIVREAEGYSCLACIAEDKIEHEKTLNKLNAERLQATEKYNKQISDEKNFIENQNKEEEQRNLIASAKINNASSEITALYNIEAQQSLNLKKVEDKYKLEFNKINFENDLFLKQLRNSSKTTSTNKNDPYWNETISPEKLFKFEIKDEKGYPVFGYKNEKESVKIAAKFSTAEEFENGYAKAEIDIKNDGITVDNQFYGSYRAHFRFIERGIIGKNGIWVKPSQKILLYTWGYENKIVLTAQNHDDDQLTEREREAKKIEHEKWELEEEEKAKREFEDELNNFLERARNQGYIIEDRN